VRRGDWLRERRRLQVSASDLSPGEGDATHTQFNLVLLDDVPVATPPPDAMDLDLSKVRGWINRCGDPEFWTRVRDVCGLHLSRRSTRSF